MEKRVNFLNYLEDTLSGLPNETASRIMDQAGGVGRIHLVFVDIIQGFCDEGVLASQRVREVVEPVRELAGFFLDRGLSADNLIFLQDAHREGAKEFAAFPPHCLRGTREAEEVKELRPFLCLEGARLFQKNATNGLFGTDREGNRFFDYLEERFAEGPTVFLVLGDCTDLCIYQNAMGIRLLANERDADARVLVSATHTRTYDMPVEAARETGAMAHDGDLMDTVFLYHMKLNGIDVVADIRAE
ncbi:isochorismatase family protein [Salinithrix halophila]|uniref:Isochorismatase family protein n=1 Tax=Salinithrix halophila TaxID=1485204 RepID=A0ABV8JHJ3_9BACL